MRNIISAFIILISCSLPFTASAKPEHYVIDKEHTAIQFAINHLGFSDMIGQFRDYDGYFIFDQEKPEDSMVEVNIRVPSIQTSSEVLDKKLQGKDWFNAEEFPEIHFKSSEITVTGENTADIRGWLTMMGVSKSVVLEVTFNKAGKIEFANRYVAGFSANTEINRSQFGLNNGVPFVGEDVRIMIQTEGIRKDKAE